MAKKAILQSCRSNSEDAKVLMVEQEDLFYIKGIIGKDQALVSLTLNDSESVTFQIDIGSSAHILPLQDFIKATKYYNKANIISKEITLVMHEPSKRKALGSERLKVGQP